MSQDAVPVGRSEPAPGDEAALVRAMLRAQLWDSGILGANPLLGDPVGGRAGGVPGASVAASLATFSFWILGCEHGFASTRVLNQIFPDPQTYIITYT